MFSIDIKVRLIYFIGWFLKFGICVFVGFIFIDVSVIVDLVIGGYV